MEQFLLLEAAEELAGIKKVEKVLVEMVNLKKNLVLLQLVEAKRIGKLV